LSNALSRCRCQLLTIHERTGSYSEGRRLRDADRYRITGWRCLRQRCHRRSRRAVRLRARHRPLGSCRSPTEVRLSLDVSQLVEGGRATIALELSAPRAIPRCDVALSVPAGLRAEEPTRWSLRLDADSPVQIEVPLTAERYVRFVIGPATTNVPGSFGLLN
jgi:hypothetical protein